MNDGYGIYMILAQFMRIEHGNHSNIEKDCEFSWNVVEGLS